MLPVSGRKTIVLTAFGRKFLRASDFVTASYERKELKAELGLEGRILIIVGELLPNKNQKTILFPSKNKGGIHMKVIVAKDYASQCAAGADIIEKIVRKKYVKSIIFPRFIKWRFFRFLLSRSQKKNDVLSHLTLNNEIHKMRTF